MDRHQYDKRTITVFIGCARSRTRMNIRLGPHKYDEWDERRLKSINVDAKDISKMLIGPSMVVQLYPYAFFQGEPILIENSSSWDAREYNIGCVHDHQLWSGHIRSFRIWDYNYWKEINKPSTCNYHTECGENEYCLCPNGYARGEYCKDTGKVCMPKSMYLQSKPRTPDDTDLVNIDCISDYLGPKRYQQFDNVKDAAAHCYGRYAVEPFGNIIYDSTNWLFLIITIILFIYIILCISGTLIK